MRDSAITPSLSLLPKNAPRAQTCKKPLRSYFAWFLSQITSQFLSTNTVCAVLFTLPKLLKFQVELLIFRRLKMRSARVLTKLKPRNFPRHLGSTEPRGKKTKQKTQPCPATLENNPDRINLSPGQKQIHTSLGTPTQPLKSQQARQHVRSFLSITVKRSRRRKVRTRGHPSGEQSRLLPCPPRPTTDSERRL